MAVVLLTACAGPGATPSRNDLSSMSAGELAGPQAELMAIFRRVVALPLHTPSQIELNGGGTWMLTVSEQYFSASGKHCVHFLKDGETAVSTLCRDANGSVNQISWASATP